MRLITFDFHNTLASCDSWFELEVFTIASEVAADIEIEADPITLNSLYREIRLEVIRSGVEISAADAVRHIFASHGIDHSSEQVEASVDRLMRRALHDLTAKPGAIETVTYLKSQGHQLGVISSAAHHNFVEWALASFGILEHFDFVMTSVQTGIYKSRPELYLRALAAVEAVSTLSLHIGDSIKWDVETASLAGMRTGWLVSEQRHPSEVLPDLTFESLHNSGPIIDRFVRSLA